MIGRQWWALGLILAVLLGAGPLAAAVPIACPSGASGKVLTCQDGTAAWVVGGGSGGGAGVWGQITGTLGDQVDLAQALAGLQPAGVYLTAESDPVFLGSPAAGVTATRAGHWDSAYGWGDHAAAGYQVAGAPGTAGVQPVEDLGETDTVSVVLDGRVYVARLSGSGDLTVSAPVQDAYRYTLLYLTATTAGAELATPGAALWLDGTPVALAPAVGEVMEVAIRRLPDGSLLLSARAYW